MCFFCFVLFSFKASASGDVSCVDEILKVSCVCFFKNRINHSYLWCSATLLTSFPSILQRIWSSRLIMSIKNNWLYSAYILTWVLNHLVCLLLVLKERFFLILSKTNFSLNSLPWKEEETKYNCTFSDFSVSNLKC